MPPFKLIRNIPAMKKRIPQIKNAVEFLLSALATGFLIIAIPSTMTITATKSNSKAITANNWFINLLLNEIITVQTGSVLNIFL